MALTRANGSVHLCSVGETGEQRSARFELGVLPYRILTTGFLTGNGKKRMRQRSPAGAGNSRKPYRTRSHSLPDHRPDKAHALDHLLPGDVQAALQAIPDRYRIAVYPADVDGFSYRQISEITGEPIGTVMHGLHRGRKQLGTCLHSSARHRRLIRSPAGPGCAATSWQRQTLKEKYTIMSDLRIHTSGAPAKGENGMGCAR